MGSEATSSVGNLAVSTRSPVTTPRRSPWPSLPPQPLATNSIPSATGSTQHEGLPFLDVLSRPLVEAACRHSAIAGGTRVYTPWITLSLFLSQVLSDDHSCDEAVDRFQKFRYDQGLPAVSTETTSYCEARQRLPEGLFWDLVRRTGRSIHRAGRTTPGSSTGGRSRSSTAPPWSCPTRPRTRRRTPSRAPRRPAWGSRSRGILVVFSLAVGTVLEAAIGPYQGKQTSELALLRQVIDQFRPGDIVLADRFFCSYWVIAALRARGVDVVVRLHQRRTADFRRGRRLGREDHVVTWTKPEQVPDWMSRAEYDAMPAELTVRELRVRVKDKTKRVRELVIVTTLMDAQGVPRPRSWGACSASGGTRNWICGR